MLVREVMTATPVTVHPWTPVKEAIRLLDEHQITMLPVVSGDDRVIGVVSESDVVRDSLPHDPRTALLPAGDIPVERGRVVDLMTRNVVHVAPEDDLADAVSAMLSINVKSVPVVDTRDQRIVGVVSRRDVVHVLARADESMEREIDELFRSLGTDWLVEVRDGVARVTGPVTVQQQALATTAAETVRGVLSVEIGR